MNKTQSKALDLIFPALSLIFLVGILTLFQPCGPREDGSWMSCHWAGRAVAGVAGAMLLLSVLRLFVGPEAKRGLDLALMVLSLLAALIPGRLIGLCMMHDMRCHMLTAPFTAVLSALTALWALCDLIASVRKGKRHEA